MEAHDVYGLGEFKDDQLQNITGRFGGTAGNAMDGAFSNASGHTDNYWWASNQAQGNPQIGMDASRVARAGLMTHGKQKGVNYIIHV